MRFIMLMIPQVYQGAVPADFSPPKDAVEKMGRYNDELTKAGVLLELDGLTPPAQGARIKFSGGKPAITDGPFAEAKEVVGGFWMIQVKSKEEAVAWAARVPAQDGDTIEVRQVYEMSDFPE
jgi:hypothetical protein